MSDKYPLWINRELVKVAEIYIKIDPLSRFGAVSQFFHSIINSKINEILDLLKKELENNNLELKKLLEQKEYKSALKAIETDLKF